MLGILAMECGWTKEYVLWSLTLSQAKRYVDVINERKNIDLSKQVEAIFHACGGAFGSIKVDELNRFIDSLSGIKKDVDVDDSLRRAKEQGLPIEEN